MEFSIRPVITAVISSLILFGCGQPTEVEIGEQIWTTQNLDVDTFRNGSRIPHASMQARKLSGSEQRKTRSLLGATIITILYMEKNTVDYITGML
jgi:hypothetical protein